MDIQVLGNLALQGALVMSKNEAGFPENPALGTMIIKDYCLYAYIRMGTMETWYPFSKSTKSYIHVQGLESTAWVVQHNLGTTDIWFQVTDNNGHVVIVNKTDIDSNTFQLDFTSAVAGKCIVVAPDSIDVPIVKASIIEAGNGYVVIDSSGVKINGSYALTNASIDAQLNAEASRAIIAETSLQDNINAEVTRASNAEATLSANILVEKTRAMNAESTLSSNVSTVTSNLNSEITRASNAEATLSANILVEKTRAVNAEATLTSNLNNEISRATAAEASLSSAISALGSAFNYVGTVNGGASSGAAYDLSALSQKDTGDYYKVALAGYFKVGSGGTPFYANLNDGLVWNLVGSVDKIDNTDSTVAGTSNEIAVSGSTDLGYTISIDTAFKTRMSSAESAILTEVTRASNAESTLQSNINAEITRASNAESTLSANINTEITRASNAESTLSANILVEKTRAMNAESTLSANLAAEITRAQAAEASIAAAISTTTIDGGSY